MATHYTDVLLEQYNFQTIQQFGQWSSVVPYVEHLVAGRSSRHDCHHQGRQVRASQTPDSLHVDAPQLQMMCQARLRRLYVSELPGERTCLPPQRRQCDRCWGWLRSVGHYRCRMTTDDCAPLKLPPKSEQKFEFYESNFRFDNEPNLKSLGLSEKKNAGLNYPRPLKCIRKIGKN